MKFKNKNRRGWGFSSVLTECLLSKLKALGLILSAGGGGGGIRHKYMACRWYLSIFLKGQNQVNEMACQVKVLATQYDNLNLIPGANKTVGVWGCASVISVLRRTDQRSPPQTGISSLLPTPISSETRSSWTYSPGWPQTLDSPTSDFFPFCASQFKSYLLKINTR